MACTIAREPRIGHALSIAGDFAAAREIVIGKMLPYLVVSICFGGGDYGA